MKIETITTTVKLTESTQNDPALQEIIKDEKLFMELFGEEQLNSDEFKNKFAELTGADKDSPELDKQIQNIIDQVGPALPCLPNYIAFNVKQYSYDDGTVLRLQGDMKDDPALCAIAENVELIKDLIGEEDTSSEEFKKRLEDNIAMGTCFPNQKR